MTTNETTMIKCSRPNCTEQIEAGISAWNNNYPDKAQRPFCSYKCGNLVVRMEEKQAKKILSEENKKNLKRWKFQKSNGFGSGDTWMFNGNSLVVNESNYGEKAHFSVTYYVIDDSLRSKRAYRKFEVEEHTPEAIQDAFKAAVGFITETPAYTTVNAEAQARRAPKTAEVQALSELNVITLRFKQEAERLLQVNLTHDASFALVEMLEANVRNGEYLLRAIAERMTNDLESWQSPVLEAVDQSQHTTAYLREVQTKHDRRDRMVKMYA